MFDFGKSNEELGTFAPGLISFQEVPSDEGYVKNSLVMMLKSHTGIVFQIVFPDYIMHLTRNESYTVWDNYEIREGRYLVLFSRSRFIDAYDPMIAHTADYSWPGRGTHYGVYTTTHIIDVITNSKPVITVL